MTELGPAHSKDNALRSGFGLWRQNLLYMSKVLGMNDCNFGGRIHDLHRIPVAVLVASCVISTLMLCLQAY